MDLLKLQDRDQLQKRLLHLLQLLHPHQLHHRHHLQRIQGCPQFGRHQSELWVKEGESSSDSDEGEKEELEAAAEEEEEVEDEQEEDDDEEEEAKREERVERNVTLVGSNLLSSSDRPLIRRDYSSEAQGQYIV